MNHLKPVFIFLFLVLTTLPTVAKAQYAPGTIVMEDFATMSIKTVSTCANGQVLLSDGTWYPMRYIHPLLDTFNGIQVGDMVMEDFQSIRIKTVSAISNEMFLLSDGSWYPMRYVHPLQDSYNGIGLGESVMESFETQTINTVSAISNEMFLLDNGIWYPSKYVHKLDCGQGGEGAKCGTQVSQTERHSEVIEIKTKPNTKVTIKVDGKTVYQN